MPGPRYTADQLKSLQNSSLVQKPQDLPAIEQWIDQPTDQSQRKAKAQGGFSNGRGDENENPSKRPSLFETRNMTRHSQTGPGEDIFLGPKISFASASAARQPGKAGGSEERELTSPADNERRQEKFGSQEKSSKPREIRPGHGEPPRARWKSDWKAGRQGNEDAEDLDAWMKKRQGEAGFKTRDALIEGDGLEGDLERPSRRHGQESGKPDMSWGSRGKISNLEDAATDGDWRAKDRRLDRDWTRGKTVDRSPQWTKDGARDEWVEHTQEDFQKWKEKMKAGSGPSQDAASKTEEAIPESAAETTKVSEKSAPPILNRNTESFFGLWGDAKKAEKKVEEKPVAGKQKSSRFANFFTPAPATTERSPPIESASPPPAQSPVKTSAEDQEGFQRMMQMLRMGGSNNGSQQPMPASMSSPPPNQFGLPANDRATQDFDARSPFTGDPQQRSDRLPMMSPEQGPSFPQSAQPPNVGEQRHRPESGSRDSEFLMKLMQQQRMPFQEGQIYGQGYERKNPDEAMSFANIYPPHAQQQHQQQQQQQQQNRGPPPGFFSNERAFGTNQSMDDGQNVRSPLEQAAERMDVPPQREMPNETFRQHADEQQNFQQMPPNFDHVPHWMNGQGGQPPHEQMLPPPPGFPPTHNRGGPGPQGFTPYPGNNPQNLRGQMPQGPGFFNGPASPPGFPGGPGGNQQPPRGPPQMMQGFDGYSEMARRGPASGQGPPPQGQYAHYLKQHGGPGQYQGM